MQRSEYVVICELGHGGFGRVDKVRKGNEVFAMKVVEKPNKYAMQEVEILKSANHPNIVKFVHYFMDNGSLKIVMEFADRGTLSSQSLNWSEQMVWKFLAQIGDAFTYLHDRDIIHRDVKPDNILCVSGGAGGIVYKIADFGIAKLVDKTLETNHYASTYAGTYCYMAPEVLNQQKYTVSADMWSLGAVTSFLCNNKRHLFTSNDEVRRVKGGIDPFPRRFSSSFREAVVTLLRVDPKERPSARTIYQKAKEKL